MKNNKKRMQLLGIVVSLLVVLLQFLQPVRENPIVDSSLSMRISLGAPNEIANILDRSCKDCHSNNTDWPVYSYVAPLSWLIAHDVQEGRKHFNMSEWGNYSKSKKINKLSGINQTITELSMPLRQYILLHSEAELSNEERASLALWSQQEAEKLLGTE